MALHNWYIKGDNWNDVEFYQNYFTFISRAGEFLGDELCMIPHVFFSFFIPSKIIHELVM